MEHNQEGDPYEYKKLNLRIASVLEDKTDRYNKKILFFEPESGKISKVIDFKKQNPYSKSKEPRLDEKLKYSSEYMSHIPPVVSYNNKYYDPSYGSPIRTNQNEWENEALSFFQAYVAHKVVINGEEKWEKIIWIGELNSNDQQTNFSN